MGKLQAQPPLGGYFKRWGALEIREDNSRELVSLASGNGQEKPFARAFEKANGKTLPGPNEMKSINGGHIFWTGQGQYMLLLSGENILADLDAVKSMDGAGYASLQSDGWASLEISGQTAYDVLERFTALDLRNAPINYAARTSAHHIAVIFLKTGETDFLILTPRSSAQSLLEALTHVAENVFLSS